MKIQYLNTDLELQAHKDLTPIVEAMDEDVIVLYNGKARGHYLATFECVGLVDGPDSIINHFCMFAECLEGTAKELWDDCFTKAFDIGFESGAFPQSYASEIRATTIQRVAALGASIRVTIYPPVSGGDDADHS